MGESLDRNRGFASGVILFILVSSLFSLPTVAKTAEVYPSRGIEFIVDSKAGGGNDMLARGAAPFITKYLREVSPGAKGGEIRIKNLAGGQGLQAHTAIYNAKPDGYTIGNINSGSIYDYVTGVTKAPFDPFKFTPLFSALRTTRVIVSGKKGATTWEELVQLSKKRPLKWAIGTLGQIMHLESIVVKEKMGLDVRLAAAGGSPQVISALLRGDADVAYLSYESCMSVVEGKEVNLLATATDKRIFPETPTLLEKGLPQDSAIALCAIRCYYGPPNMDPEAVRLLIAAWRKVMEDPGYLSFLKTAGVIELSPLYGSEIHSWLKSYIDFYVKFDPVIRRNLKK